MEKGQRLKDYLVSRVMASGRIVDGYSRVHYQTNENLIDPYLDVDFKDKEVLSILTSGDHVLTSDFLEAKKTDSFGTNRLELYYYYLRIWSIEHKDCLYPNIFDDDSNEWLKDLLRYVEPRTEQEKSALSLFQQHALLGTNLTPLFYDDERMPEGKTLFTKASELKDCLNPDLVYYPTNLFEQVSIDSTYDIVLISKILNWAKGDIKKLKQAKDNLARLVRKDGTVICSNIKQYLPSEREKEVEIFSESFEYQPKEKGYVYIKKN